MYSDFFQNKIDLKLKSSSSENQIEDKQTSSFVFRDLFCSKPEIENEEEIKLGIHYSIDFKDVYKQGRKLGEVFLYISIFKKAKLNLGMRWSCKKS